MLILRILQDSTLDPGSEPRLVDQLGCWSLVAEIWIGSGVESANVRTVDDKFNLFYTNIRQTFSEVT
ncbi:hypothetical protein ACJZ2D_006220 [Fusarium nematophilum]